MESGNDSILTAIGRRRIWFDRSIRRALAGATVLILVAVVGACGGGDDTVAANGTTNANEATKEISVALAWVHGPDYLPAYYAEEKGYFADAGVEPNLQVPPGSASSLKVLATGRVDLAFSHEPEMFLAAEQGLPVVGVAAIYPTTLSSIVARAETNIKSIEDLRGRTVGYDGLPQTQAMLKEILSEHGMTTDDLKVINVGFNLVQTQLSGQVDAVAGSYLNISGLELDMRTEGDATIIPMGEAGVPMYHEIVLAANSVRLENDSEYAANVERVVGAIVNGIDGVQQEPEVGLEAMKAASDFDDAFLELSAEVSLPMLDSPAGLKSGCFDIGASEAFGDWLLENELITSNVAGDIVTNEYLPYDC